MQVRAIIEAAITNDPTATADEKERILRALKPTDPKPKVIPISSKEAAAMLGVHVVTLRRYEKEGKLRAIRMSPRKIRWDRTALENFIASGAEKTTALDRRTEAKAGRYMPQTKYVAKPHARPMKKSEVRV